MTILEQDLKQAEGLRRAIAKAQHTFESEINAMELVLAGRKQQFHDSELTLRYETVRNILLLLRVELDNLIENWQEELKVDR